MNIKMIRRSTLATTLALGMTWAAGAAGAATRVSVGVQLGSRATVDIGFFQSNLQPYGRWLDRGQYGRVFVPRVSRTSWRPYSLGHWVETDYGSTWISDEPFGWATYHYGRWLFDPELGWVWVPGTEWGPAWVDFEESDGYIGWAPLPPSVEFDYGSGLRLGGFRAGYDVPATSYCFVEERRFLEPRIATYIAAPTRNVNFIHRARRLTSYAVENQRVINRSLPVARLERATGRRVQRFQVADVGGNTPVRQARFRGNQVQIYRPQVVNQPGNGPGRPGREAVAQQQVRERQQQQQATQAQRQQTRAQQQQQREAQNQQAQQQRQQARQQQAQQRNQVQQQRAAQNQQAQQQRQEARRQQQEQRAAQNQQAQQQRQEARRQQQEQRNRVNEQRAAQGQQAQQRQEARQQQNQARAQQQEQRRQAQAQQQQQRAQARENRGQGRPPQANNGGGGGGGRQHGGGGHGKPREDKPPGR
jgi:hypothetical protein